MAFFFVFGILFFFCILEPIALPRPPGGNISHCLVQVAHRWTMFPSFFLRWRDPGGARRARLCGSEVRTDHQAAGQLWEHLKKKNSEFTFNLMTDWSRVEFSQSLNTDISLTSVSVLSLWCSAPSMEPRFWGVTNQKKKARKRKADNLCSPPTPLGLQGTIAESVYIGRPLVHCILPLHFGIRSKNINRFRELLY